MSKMNIDTQSDEYYLFKQCRFERAQYFFKDERGINAYKVYKKFNRNKNPVLEYNGGYLCDHLEKPKIDEITWNECVRVYNNSLARKKRLNSRLNAFKGYTYFVTITFNDDMIKMTSESRRHNLINPLIKYLKEQCGLNDYVGVKEYGRKTDREHYHFLMCFDDKLQGNIKTIKTSHGRFKEVLKNTVIEQYHKALVDVEEISGDVSKVKSYICKVAGYIDKDTGKTQHLIYCSNGTVKNEPLYQVDDDGFIQVDEDSEFYKDICDIF